MLTTRVLHALQQDALGVEHGESEGVARTSIGDLEYRVQSTTRGRLQITDYRLQCTTTLRGDSSHETLFFCSSV